MGALHCTRTDIKQALNSKKNNAIPEAVTTGEKATLEKQDQALQHYKEHTGHFAMPEKQRAGITEALAAMASR